jgi:hypothetical protein
MTYLPNGTTLPAAGALQHGVGLVGEIMYKYCRTSEGCISADQSEKILLDVVVPAGWCTLPSIATSPSTGSKRRRSNHIGSWVTFWMCTSRYTLSFSVGDMSAVADCGM